jgi:hypothetical protein
LTVIELRVRYARRPTQFHLYRNARNKTKTFCAVPFRPESYPRVNVEQSKHENIDAFVCNMEVRFGVGD